MIGKEQTAVEKQGKQKMQMILSMVIFGTLAPFVRGIDLTSGELALYRAVLALLFIGSYMLATGQKLVFKQLGREILLLLISGTAIGINWILLFEAYKYTTVSVATLSYYFAPVIVMVLSPLLFREKLTPKQLLCFGMSTLGLVLITGVGDLGQGKNHLTGIALGVSAAVFYAAVMLLNKYIKGVDGITRTFYQFSATAITLLPYVLFTGGVHLGALDGKGWILLLVVGIVHTGVTYCMYFSAVRELPGQKTAILSYIDPLTAVVISVTVLKEDLNLWQAAGGLLILGFTVWNDISQKRKDETLSAS